MVKHAYNTVGFYKRLFDESGLQPYDIKSIEDIIKIPIIDKEILRKFSYDELISKNYKWNNLISIKTAGSSGMPFKFFIDNLFDQFRKAQCLRPYITNGKKLFDHTISFSVHKAPPKKWFHKFNIMKESRILSEEETDLQIKTIKN